MQDDRVLFIRGTGRCGSKNLVTRLGHHPELAHVPVNQIVPEELIDWSVRRLQASDPRISDESVKSACRAYFAAYGRASAGREGILLQKSTRHAHHLTTLLEYWPEARIVYLVRHPFGVVEAFINAAAHDRSDAMPDYGYRASVVDSLLQWYAEIREYVDSSAFGHPRLLQIQFERLIAAPDETCRQICRFIGVAETPLPQYGGPEVYQEPFVLNEAERGWIIDSTADILRQLGYNPSEWSSDVPAEGRPFLDLYAECHMHSAPPTLDAGELTSMALVEASRRGCRRAGLFGAGYFTRRACPRLRKVPIEVVGIFDENPALHGSTIAGLPVRAPEDAGDLEVDVIIPMTFVYQEKMVRRWRALYGSAASIVPLWNDQQTAEVEIDA